MEEINQNNDQRQSLNNTTNTSISDNFNQSEVVVSKKNWSKSEFEKELIKFFILYYKNKLRLVPRIVEEFTGNEDEVMEFLNKKYSYRIRKRTQGYTPLSSKKVESNTNISSLEEIHPIDAKQPKRKKRFKFF